MNLYVNTLGRKFLPVKLRLCSMLRKNSSSSASDNNDDSSNNLKANQRANIRKQIENLTNEVHAVNEELRSSANIPCINYLEMNFIQFKCLFDSRALIAKSQNVDDDLQESLITDFNSLDADVQEHVKNSVEADLLMYEFLFLTPVVELDPENKRIELLKKRAELYQREKEEPSDEAVAVGPAVKIKIVG